MLKKKKVLDSDHENDKGIRRRSYQCIPDLDISVDVGEGHGGRFVDLCYPSISHVYRVVIAIRQFREWDFQVTRPLEFHRILYIT